MNEPRMKRAIKRQAIKLLVLEAIESERAYQEKKWPGHRHSVGEWIIIMESCLEKAKTKWMDGDAGALKEIRQVVAVGVAAMEQCGVTPRVTETSIRGTGSLQN